MVRFLCFLLVAVTFFGLVESNNNCVVDLTDCPSKPYSKRVKRSRGCSPVTTPTFVIKTPSNECKKMEYTVHLSNRAATYWGSKVCYRTYQVCRGKKETQSPTPVQTCTVSKVTGEWKKLRQIMYESTTTTSITVGTAVTTGSTIGSEWSTKVGTSISLGFSAGGYSAGVEISAETGEKFFEQNSETITNTQTKQISSTIAYETAMLGKDEWQFVLTSEGKCGDTSKTTRTSLPSLAYSNAGEKPCCLPDEFSDANQFTSNVCRKTEVVISTESYCRVSGIHEVDPFESAKEALKGCDWALNVIPKQPEPQSAWDGLAADCSLSQAQLQALKIYSARCQRCPNSCVQKSTLTTIGVCADPTPKKLTFGTNACCCPADYETDCTGTLLRTAINGLTNTSTQEVSSAESASKTLFSCSVVVFILHLLL